MGSIAAFVASAAMAQEICVSCKEPDRGYRCSVKDSEKVKNVRGSRRAIEFLCVSEIARAGGHRSCSVGSNFSGPCIGQDIEVDLAKAAPDGQAELGVDPDRPEGGSPAPGARQAAPSGPPQTLEELARDTMSKSKEQISAADEKMRKAGDAVGGTMKKTWDCLASLFSRC